MGQSQQAHATEAAGTLGMERVSRTLHPDPAPARQQGCATALENHSGTDARSRGRQPTFMPINEKLRDDMIDKLFEAILTLRTVEECYRFFEDAATVGEIKALAQRLEVAKMLAEGLTYEDIVATTGASTATISRVKKCLHYGADGYRIVLQRLDNSKS